MGSKVQVNDITNVGNNSGVPIINRNFDKVADEFDKVLYRDGSQALTGDIDADSNRIVNLPAPVSDHEPIRLTDLEGISEPAFTVQLNAKVGIGDLASDTGAAGVGFLQDGAGAVSRSVEEELRDRVSVKQFGAKGDLSVDDTAAINKAITRASISGSTVFFPAGTYKVSNSGDYTALMPLPLNVNLDFEPGASLSVYETSTYLQIVTPLGNNIIRNLTIDGRGLPEEITDFDDETDWAPIVHVGIRAAFDVAHGLGAKNVTIIGGNLRNLSYGIQTSGAINWTITGMTIQRIMLSAQLHGYEDNYPCRQVHISNCYSETTGDTSVAFYPLISSSINTEVAYCSITNCHAKDSQLITQGYAFDVEARGDNNPDYQHHVVFSNLVVEQTITGRAWGVCGIVLNTCSLSSITGSTCKGSLNSNGDYGITVGAGSRDCVVSGNTISDFRSYGIGTDGSTDILVKGNSVVDCGGVNQLYSGIQISLAYSTSGIVVIDNFVKVTESGTYLNTNWQGISVYNTGTLTLSDITIRGNTIVSPLGSGIYVIGASGSRATNIVIEDNKIISTDIALTNTIANIPMQVYYASQVTVRNNIMKDVRYGYFVNNCDKVTISGCEVQGTNPLLALYDFTNATEVRVKDMRCNVPAVSVVFGPGTGTIWENDDKIPLIDAADDAAAAAITSPVPIPVGMKYRTGSIIKIRVA
jgi:hypothetical protein